jgi:hypothetical protein
MTWCWETPLKVVQAILSAIRQNVVLKTRYVAE